MYDIESGEIKIDKSSMSDFSSFPSLEPFTGQSVVSEVYPGQDRLLTNHHNIWSCKDQSDSKSGQVEHSIFTLMSETLMTKYPNNTNWRGGLCEKGQSEQGWIKDLEDVRFWRFWGAWQRNHWQKGEQWAKWQQHCRIELRGRLTAELVLKY